MRSKIRKDLDEILNTQGNIVYNDKRSYGARIKFRSVIATPEQLAEIDKLPHVLLAEQIKTYYPSLCVYLDCRAMLT